MGRPTARRAAGKRRGQLRLKPTLLGSGCLTKAELDARIPQLRSAVSMFSFVLHPRHACMMADFFGHDHGGTRWKERCRMVTM